MIQSSQGGDNGSCLPDFRVIDSRAHPAAASNVPVYQHNMVPFEVPVAGQTLKSLAICGKMRFGGAWRA